jgi:hypothetical protein
VSGKNASCFWTDFVALRLLCKFLLFWGEEVFSGLVWGRASEDETRKWPRPTRNPKVKQVRAWKARRWNPKVAKANPDVCVCVCACVYVCVCVCMCV